MGSSSSRVGNWIVCNPRRKTPPSVEFTPVVNCEASVLGQTDLLGLPGPQIQGFSFNDVESKEKPHGCARTIPLPYALGGQGPQSKAHVSMSASKTIHACSFSLCPCRLTTHTI